MLRDALAADLHALERAETKPLGESGRDLDETAGFASAKGAADAVASRLQLLSAEASKLKAEEAKLLTEAQTLVDTVAGALQEGDKRYKAVALVRDQCVAKCAALGQDVAAGRAALVAGQASRRA